MTTKNENVKKVEEKIKVKIQGYYNSSMKFEKLPSILQSKPYQQSDEPKECMLLPTK